MRSPCYDCELLMADKGNAACTNCRDRIDYVNGISRARHFIREEKMENMNRMEPTSPGAGLTMPAPAEVESLRPKKVAITEKACKKCLQVKPLEAFPQNKECANGREGSCKECRLKYQKDQYHARKRKMETEKNQAVIQKHIAKKRGKETILEPLEAKPEIEPAAEPAKAPHGFDVLPNDRPEGCQPAVQKGNDVLDSGIEKAFEPFWVERMEDYFERFGSAMQEIAQSVQAKIDSLDYNRLIPYTEISPDNRTMLKPGIDLLDPAFIHGDLTIQVAFSDHPELHDFLCRTAAREFRSVVNQLLFWISGIYEANKIADA